MDRTKLEEGIRLFIEGFELDRTGGRFDGDDLDKTPARVAKAWREDLLVGYTLDPAEQVTWTAAPAAIF